MNGGTNSIYNPQSFYSDDVIVLKNPTKYGYGFDCWTLNGVEIEVIEPGIYENITLVANWMCEEIYATSSKSDYTLSDSYVIVYLDNLSTTKNVKFIVEEDVLQVTFICSNSKMFNANVVVNNRNLSLTINLNNVYF